MCSSLTNRVASEVEEEKKIIQNLFEEIFQLFVFLYSYREHRDKISDRNTLIVEFDLKRSSRFLLYFHDDPSQ